MGQYYNVYLERDNKITVFNRTVDGSYTPAKLTEHSWWYNPFVNTICQKIHFNKAKIAWVGDYSCDVGFEHYDLCWSENAETEEVTEAQISLFYKYLVNHTKKEFVDCNNYYHNSLIKKENWDGCLHPLPLLTCVGNGLGGGDYIGTSMEYIGSWCLDEISVENEKPVDYKEISPVFIERQYLNR